MNTELTMAPPEQVADHENNHRQANYLPLECLTIAECAVLSRQILNLLNEGQGVMLGLSQCQEVDTAGIQLLVALQNDPTTNLRVHWTTPSEVLAMKAARLGVQSWLNAGVREEQAHGL